MGLTLRRRFGFSGAALTAYEDERFTAAAKRVPVRAESEAKPTSNLLIAEIERPTIRPDAGHRGHDPARAGRHRPRRTPATTVCVQGAPGTGKTAVGPAPRRLPAVRAQGAGDQARRHRRRAEPGLPLLHQERPARARRTRRHPDHGDRPGRPRSRSRGADTDEAGRVKGDARMAEVLRRALWAAIRPPRQTLMVSRAARGAGGCPRTRSRRWPRELRDRGVRYGAGRELLAHRIAHVILTRWKRPGRPATTGRTTRCAAPRRYASAWTRCGRRWTRSGWCSACCRSAAKLATHADGLLSTPSSRPSCGRVPPRGPGSAPWTPRRPGADRRGGRPHRAHAERSRTWWWTRRRTCRRWSAGRSGGGARPGRRPCSATSRRAPRPWAATSWPALLGHLGKPDAAVRELDVGYRVPRQILDYASRLLPSIAPGLRPAASLRQDPGSLTVESGAGRPVRPAAGVGLRQRA